MKKIMSYSVSMFVVVVVLMLIIPLNPFLLDVLIIMNISISLIILLISMNIREPLEFSIFPSLLLITTLFRLGINVSSTRNILANQGTAGQVIAAFGNFVLQGNVVIGFIVFFIIVLVQFLVINKGAERVAEVAARFTLDAMPGKQMAIDADLSSGLITEQESRMRRDKIQREADFFGSMDGATKFVKGDAIMSLLTTAINFIGGVVMGMVMSDMEFTEVLSVYSIATVGDGLAAQVPALLISAATGMVVTRAVADGSLNEDVSKQFLAQPTAIMMTGMVLLVLVLVPGMPKFQMTLLAVAMIAGGYLLGQRTRQAAQHLEAENALFESSEETQEVDEGEFYKDINNVYSLINVEPIEMEFGYSLIPLVDESSGGKMINRIVIFRRQYAADMGLVIPSVSLRDSSSLNTNQYIIKIRGEEVARGEILVDYYLALEPSEPAGEISGIETIEPAYGIPSKWILPENKEMAEIYGYTVIDPLSVMLTHLSETIKRHAHELLTRQEVMHLLENVKKSSPELTDEVFPAIIGYSAFQKILVSLLKEGIPIKDMETILETIADSVSTTKDIVQVTENIRIALKRTITRRFCQGGQMCVLTLDADLEKTFVSSLTKGENGIYPALSPDVMQSIITQVGDGIRKFNEISQDVVILTSQVIRVYVYQLLEQFYPGIYVLSFQEIANNVQVQAIGNITL